MASNEMTIEEITDDWFDQFFSTLSAGQSITPEQAIPQILAELIAGMNEGDQQAEIILRQWMWDGAEKAVGPAASRQGARVTWDDHDLLAYMDAHLQFLGVQASE